MRYLIFSDIHSNLEALNAVLDDAAGKSYDAVICLGDLVGYGANPNECVHRVAEIADVTVVLGNHDSAVIDSTERDFFNPVARSAILYSDASIDSHSRAFLETLPLTMEMASGFMIAHASPYNPRSWVYVLDPIEAADAFHVMKSQLAFIGHTHFPVVHSDAGWLRPFQMGEKVRMEQGSRFIINVGSVGQPRDGDPRAAYVVYDDERKVAEIHRVEYDIDAAASKIVDAGLPPMLADRLRRGY